MPEAKPDLQKVHTLAKTTVLCQSFSPLVYDMELPGDIGAFLSNLSRGMVYHIPITQLTMS